MILSSSNVSFKDMEVCTAIQLDANIDHPNSAGIMDDFSDIGGQEERSRNFEFPGFPRGNESGKSFCLQLPVICGTLGKEKFQMAFLEKAKKQDLVLLAEELGQKVSDKMTIIDLKNIIIGSKDYEEEFVRAQLSVISEERVERETKEKIARQHAIQQLRWESELNELRLEIESIRSNVKRMSCAEDRKKTSSNYLISIGMAEEHMRETSSAVLMAEATIPVTTPIKEEKGMDDLRVVHVKVKGEQGILNVAIDTGAQIPVVTADVEGQSVDNKGTIQITSAFWEHEIGEVKDSNMELNDLRHGVVPVSKNLVNDMLICSSDYEVLTENSQMIRNPAKLREPSKEEGIISSTDSKSVCSQEVITSLRPETYTQSLLNVPNGDLVAVKINASNVQTNGQDWDSPIPQQLIEDWLQFQKAFNEINYFTVPRWVILTADNTVELHGFADASSLAYAAAIYCRQKHTGKIEVQLFVSKTTVAPVKQVSIPRLELCGAHLLSKLFKSVLRTLKHYTFDVFAWTDSKIGLSWLSSHPRKWKTFVANSTSEIMEVLPTKHWRHVPSTENPEVLILKLTRWHVMVARTTLAKARNF
ncbi:uncharacterized protein TNCV_75581 [Trichonephila clavipes]|nr:uncharacterized protein TNCV_75581 [Trichonephila clavipes]